MRAVLRVAVGNDIPPVKGFALRESGGMREGGGDRAIGRGRLFVKMITLLNLRNLNLNFINIIRKLVCTSW